MGLLKFFNQTTGGIRTTVFFGATVCRLLGTVKPMLAPSVPFKAAQIIPVASLGKPLEK
jgi:hypothetical protein